MTREIVLDTETTGLYPSQGDRIIEIGAIELIDGKRTGVQFHTYLNPDREVSEGAYRINGLSLEMLKDKPRFKDVASNFLEFISSAERFVIHNAMFDIEFLHRELKIADVPNYGAYWFDYACTKKMSGGLSLDELCDKYAIDTSHRKTHGALIDAELLAKCWIAMQKDELESLV